MAKRTEIYATLSLSPEERAFSHDCLIADMAGMDEKAAATSDPAEIAFYGSTTARYRVLVGKLESGRARLAVTEDELRILAGMLSQRMLRAAREQLPEYGVCVSLDAKLSRPFMDDTSGDAEIEDDDEDEDENLDGDAPSARAR